MSMKPIQRESSRCVPQAIVERVRTWAGRWPRIGRPVVHDHGALLDVRSEHVAMASVLPLS